MVSPLRAQQSSRLVGLTERVVSTKVSLAALALLIWRVINAETARLMKPEPGPGIKEKYAARWGTQTHGRKTPYGAQKKTVSTSLVFLLEMIRD
jgi:hypothetical protein